MTSVEQQREVVQIIEPIYAETGGGGGGGSATLGGLDDVVITTPADRQVLTYVGADLVWENESLTKSDVGLSNVDNTSDAAKPISSATQTALNGKAATAHTHTASQVTDFSAAADARVQLVVDGAPTALNTLDKIAAAINDDPAFAATVAAALAAKQAADADLTAIAGLTPADGDLIQRVTGAWTSRTTAQVKASLGVTSADIGLGNVNNTSDANKPISTATQAALDGKQPLDSDLTAIAAIAPANDDVVQRKGGVWTNRTPAQVKVDLALTKGDVGLGNADNTSDANKPVSVATQAALDLKQGLDADLTAIADLAPVNDDVIQRKGGAWVNRTPAQLKADLTLTKGDVGLGNVDNTSDANKPVSTAQQTALDAKISASLVNAKGDLIVATADDTVSRLAVGSDTFVLTADASQSAGMRWAAASGSGDRELYQPSASGLVEWTSDTKDCSADFNHGSGNLLMVRFRYRGTAATITEIGFAVTSAASGPGAFSGVALYEDGTGVVNRLGQSADAGTQWTSQGVKSIALTAPVNVVTGNYYRAAILWQGSGNGRIAGSAASILDALLNNGVRRSTFLSAQTGFPSTVTVSSMSTNNALYWLGFKGA